MKVRELIKQLECSGAEDDADVLFTFNGITNSGELLNISSIEITSLSEYYEENISEKQFVLLYSNRDKL